MSLEDSVKQGAKAYDELPEWAKEALKLETGEYEHSAVVAGCVPRSLDDMWPDFLRWVADYAGGNFEAANSAYSREDMRYAFQAGYELGKREGT